MTKIRLILIIISVFCLNNIFSQDALLYISEKVEKSWETSDEFRKPESVCFDKITGEIYVSNINGNPTVKDSDGFISKMNKNGQIISLQWIKGLHAPKGMGIYENLLFVTDIDQLVILDRITGKLIERVDIQGASFLNDIVIDTSGIVYISDTYSKKLFSYNNGIITVVLNEDVLESPNGLTIKDGELYIGNNGFILKYHIATKKSATHCRTTTGVDGLKFTKDGDCIFSDWYGNIFCVDDDKDLEKLLDTTKIGINAADIEYIPQLNLILIPTFAYNTVSAYVIK